MSEALPTDLIISAQIRIAGQSGVPMTIVHRGDANSGTILLKINKLDGTARVLSQVRLGDEVVWSPISSQTDMPESQADAYLATQVDFDPDIWVVEVEDRQGNPWFPGRILPP